MLTIDELMNSEVFRSILDEMEIEEPLDSVLRRVGREHHANFAQLKSGHAELTDCISYSLVDEFPERQHIAEIAAVIARECVGGVLIVTAQSEELTDESIYLWGRPEDIKAVSIAQKAILWLADSINHEPIFTDNEDIETSFDLGILKGFLSKMAYAHDSKSSIDSLTTSITKEKEAFAKQQLKSAGVEPMLVNLTYFVLDCLKEISMEAGKESGESNW